jgi:energy-coupling factor transporter ATP-binding protein EcfA2
VILLSARELCVAPPAGPGGAAAAAPLVRDFSIDLGAGEWIALGGENGCGKTSLLLALAGLAPARSGRLLLGGEPFGPEVPRERRARMAVVLQDPSSQLLQPTVRDELAFTARNLGMDEDETAPRVTRWAGRLGLEAELDRDPQTLSAGRQQLVLLAAALVPEPALLLADEPAAHLDRAARSLVLAVIRDRVREGLAVLWVTQDEAERAAADRLLHLGNATRPGLMPQPTTPSAAAGETLLSIHVAVDPGGEGPRVSTPRPLAFDLPARGVVTLEGRNGVGKSVVLAAAAGLLRVDQVRVDAIRPLRPPPMLASQYPELEIFEELAADEVVYAATARGIPRAQALRGAGALLERLRMGGERFLERRVWDLSGGEKRIASLVGALIAPAALLALDEPTAGLDDVRRETLAALVGEVARERSVLVASQDGPWLGSLGGARLRLG